MADNVSLRSSISKILQPLQNLNINEERKSTKQQKQPQVGYVANQVLRPNNNLPATPRPLILAFVPNTTPLEQFLNQYIGKDIIDNDEILLFWNSLSMNLAKWECLWNDPRINSVRVYTCKNLNRFNIQELGSISKAFAKLECRDTHSINVLANVVTQKLPLNIRLNNADCITNVIWAFNKLRCQDPGFINSITLILLKNLPNKQLYINGQQLATIASSFLRFPGNHTKITSFLKERIQCKLLKDDFFKAKELIDILALFTKFKCTDQKFLEDLKKPVVENIRRQFYSCNDLARISCLFAVSRYIDDELIRCLKGSIWRCLQRQNDFTSKDLINITASFAIFHCQDCKFIFELEQTINTRKQEHNFFSAEDIEKISEALEALKEVKNKPAIVY